ncbi:Hypothetical protein LUCI_4588 [Lucifera butyrica]|uniref:Organic solvent tolerance-like N-terminal domain-containing protein n=1 Tax=Lucifera butyrica TaxID=1351585 RepID=A0A498RJU1_9FIRM|nr:LptA/OstA family protein [Lucifera butyrica]VBB09298.1 Hypothetical protein LUCI_4588 [Lucifera butyrica]
MHFHKQIAVGLVGFLTALSLSAPIAAAAASQQKTAAPTAAAPKAPVAVDANELSYDESNGDFFAQGNVIITQNDGKITTDRAEGNTQKYEIWVKDKAYMTQPGLQLTGSALKYNYHAKTGTVGEATGWVEKERVYGNHIEIYPDKDIIKNGWITRCPAKVPDYHISAERIEIWPGDHYIAYNAKFWFKKVELFSMAKYRGSLKKGAQSDFPKIGQSSSDGFYIGQRVEYPLTEKLSAFANINYYTKHGFKPDYGLADREQGYTVRLVQGDYEDSDDNWIRKEPELQFDLDSRRIGKLPLQYSFTASYGKWNDDIKSSWHQDYKLYFTRDPINFSKSLHLYLGSGFENVRESYDGSSNNIFLLDSMLSKDWSNRFNTWIAYHNRSNTTALFAYESADRNRELDSGFTYRIDRMDALSVSRTYNLETNQVTDLDYTWHRNLHCWQLDLMYRAKRHQIHWDISVAQW